MHQVIAAYLISVLTRRLMLKPAEFKARYPHAWLVWEPGSWSEPKSPEMAASETLQPGQERPIAPVGEDALCFELKPSGTSLKVGRAPDNQIILNDMRVSRSQLELRHVGGFWQVVPVRGARNILLGEPLDEQGVKIAGTIKLQAGGIQLSFYDAADFAARLQTEAQRYTR